MQSTLSPPERILDFAWFAFNQKGFRRTSMDMIAKELRISKKTIYKYFASKEQLLEECLQRRFDAFEKRIPEVLVPEDRTEAFYRFFSLYGEYTADMSEILRGELRTDIPYLEDRILFFESQAFLKKMSTFLKALRTSKAIDYPSPTREFSAALLGAMRGLHGQAPDKVRFLLELFSQGISSSKSSGKNKKRRKR